MSIDSSVGVNEVVKLNKVINKGYLKTEIRLNSS
jgi:hypothetical protein